ncbi:uncharacterized protein LOC115580079 isoform X2 [Sparus aurata]|uniref:uncharacterized protein LOC115580079 isoform X2 n=1 Tax=Sparus aurata TaxID=8175 RepID=UPI0011C19645|nr:uncharacterized protein LOC115580079 isoform X2 [Sparus aurata]XP_030269805.1 uncharacterized protein LOC115580079 isoform X2 [Sparus aurata]
MHHSIYEEGTGLKVERCTACCKLFHCPFCPKYKPSQRAKLQQHLDVHMKNAITYKDAATSTSTPSANPSSGDTPLCTAQEPTKMFLQKKTNPDLFRTEIAPSTPKQQQGTVYPPSGEKLKQLVHYIYKHKKLPDSLPDDLVKPRASYITELHPIEASCTICPGSVQLDESKLISKNARIISINGVIKHVSTYFRQCPHCHMMYRYQEWQDGLHNFDDHIILSLELCLYLRANLQNNISVSKVVDSLEKLRKVTFLSRDAVLHAYLHFEALTSHDYSYSCACCGYHPPVVVMDLHKKGVFNLPVSDIREVPENFTGEVDIEEFWDSVQLEMIARAFFPSRAKNIFAVHPSFEHWAPWIGKNTQTDNVLNSEFEKVSHSKSSAEAELSIVSEDRLTDELMKQKVSTVRKLCKACNLDDKGSRMDLLTRLRDEMKNRHTYDKIFQKIWGASGGWSVILCPHGVVYSLKFNLRAESPRDFTD